MQKEYAAISAFSNHSFWRSLALSVSGVLLAFVLFFIPAFASASCTPPAGGNHAVTADCAFSGSVDGADNGDFTVNAGVTLTVNAGQMLVINPSRKLVVNGTIALNVTAQIRKTYLWMTDADADGYPAAATQLAQDTAPASGRRRYLMASLAVADCNDAIYSAANDCGGGGGGSLSLTYSTTSNPTAGSDIGFAFALDESDSAMYVAGMDSGGAFEWRIEKRNLSNGSLVYATTSNPGGGAVDHAEGVAVDSAGGAFYVVGNRGGSPTLARLEKRNLSNGSLVYATTSLSAAQGVIAYDIAVDTAGGTMYIASTYEASVGDVGWRIEKRNLSNGSLVYAATSNPTASDDQPNSIVLAGSAMYVAGYENGYSAGDDARWRIEKRNLSDGSLAYAATSDPSIDLWTDVAFDVGVHATSGAMYVVGEQMVEDVVFGNSVGWRIEKRDLATGALQNATTSNPTIGGDVARAVGVASDGSAVYVIGWGDSDALRVERRSP